MPSESQQILRAAAYFPVPDLIASADHYEQVLGFSREYVGGTPPEFAILSRDGFPIMLKLVPRTTRLSPNEQQGGTWDAFFWVRDCPRAARGACRAWRGNRLRPYRPAGIQHGRVRRPRS